MRFGAKFIWVLFLNRIFWVFFQSVQKKACFKTKSLKKLPSGPFWHKFTTQLSRAWGILIPISFSIKRSVFQHLVCKSKNVIEHILLGVDYFPQFVQFCFFFLFLFLLTFCGVVDKLFKPGLLVDISQSPSRQVTTSLPATWTIVHRKIQAWKGVIFRKRFISLLVHDNWMIISPLNF